jgi:hypothetical protein
MRAQVIFVFGSNTRGAHGAFAARDAVRYYGAIHGQAEGLQGRSYAIPTCDDRIAPLPLVRIALHVDRFLDFAQAHPTLTFLVTKIATGAAGYTESEIAPLFRSAPLNVCLPDGWDDDASADGQAA